MQEDGLFNVVAGEIDVGERNVMLARGSFAGDLCLFGRSMRSNPRGMFA